MRSASRSLLLGAIAACSGSCLVVSDPEFRGQEDCIPFFVTSQAEPALEDKFALESTDESFVGTVPMRSCALTKEYELRVFLDGELKQIVPVPPTGEEERDVTVGVSRGKPGCHQVEVYVSSRFSSSDPRVAERADDLAKLVWWFYDQASTPFEQCGSP